MMTEDFTKLTLGSLVSMSRTIIQCPLCGRLGALEVRDGGERRCVHVEDSVIHTDGLLVEPRDYCELAGVHPMAEAAAQASW
jgi:hypothetical protein